MKAEFTISVVRDPTGCNTDPTYGLKSANPTISVFRRPRMAANLRYITNLPNDRRYLINVKTGEALPWDPDSETSTLSLNLMADGRHITLRDQFLGAQKAHLPLSPAYSGPDQTRLLKFLGQVYTAQVFDRTGGNLVEQDGPKGLGPVNLSIGESGLSGEAVDTPVFQRFDSWAAKSGNKQSSEAEFRASVARGSDLFTGRMFMVRNVSNINSIGLGNPVKRSCALCHNAQMTGHDGAPGWMDIGTDNWPWAGEDKSLPLFKLTCRADAPPHPFLGREIYTSDPGRALISGKCRDIGSITIQQLRGLSARGPYFHNGSAKNLREVIDFYDRRFAIGYTEQEKQDLVNFLQVL